MTSVCRAAVCECRSGGSPEFNCRAQSQAVVLRVNPFVREQAASVRSSAGEDSSLRQCPAPRQAATGRFYGLNPAYRAALSSGASETMPFGRRTAWRVIARRGAYFVRWVAVVLVHAVTVFFCPSFVCPGLPRILWQPGAVRVERVI